MPTIPALSLMAVDSKNYDDKPKEPYFLLKCPPGSVLRTTDLETQTHRWHHPYGRKWRTKEPLDETEKLGLKLNIQKTKIMTSSPTTSWQIDGETIETVTDLIFLDSKITANGDCSHESKRHLLLERKAMINLDSILKCRDVTLLTKVY